MPADKRQIEMSLQLALKQHVKMHVLAGFHDIDRLKIVAVFNAVIIMRHRRINPQRSDLRIIAEQNQTSFYLAGEFLIGCGIIRFGFKINDVIQIGIGNDRVIRMIRQKMPPVLSGFNRQILDVRMNFPGTIADQMSGRRNFIHHRRQHPGRRRLAMAARHAQTRIVFHQSA